VNDNCWTSSSEAAYAEIASRRKDASKRPMGSKQLRVPATVVQRLLQLVEINQPPPPARSKSMHEAMKGIVERSPQRMITAPRLIGQVPARDLRWARAVRPTATDWRIVPQLIPGSEVRPLGWATRVDDRERFSEGAAIALSAVGRV
jgi:hypothetical protein